MARPKQPPPEALFVLGGISQYLGAATAVGLFAQIAPASVALLRVLAAGLVIIGFRRSWRRSWSKHDLVWAGAFGVVLALMNLLIYLAMDRLPLGNAVAIEFLGPVAVAAIGTRTVRSTLALVLAASGVLVLAGLQSEGTLVGVIFALLAGAMWAGYIVLGHRVARDGPAVDGLGVGMLIGALVISPLGIVGVGDAFASPGLLALALATGLLSNVIPYGIDQLVMSKITRARFALLQSLLPVTAAVIGFLALSQSPGVAECFGIGAVMLAIAIGGAE
ncbi:MAG: EamA family transporter [Acidimicrobiales bacterium]|nr:EamA family transporter [Acidimicrobiales bacterium]|tara:strand:+ start:2945 stop:3775 length:831 start_codon:yes stop_codon:yes gene_type:complete